MANGSSDWEKFVKKQLDAYEHQNLLCSYAEVLTQLERLLAGELIGLKIDDDRGGSGAFKVYTTTMKKPVATCPTCGKEIT